MVGNGCAADGVLDAEFISIAINHGLFAPKPSLCPAVVVVVQLTINRVAKMAMLATHPQNTKKKVDLSVSLLLQVVMV